MDKLLSVVLCVALVFLVIGLLPVHGEDRIYEDVLRLHVIANSDSTEDQNLKLEVRDRILAFAQVLLKNASSRDEAAGILGQHLKELETCAEKTVAEKGYDYPVSVLLGEETYPTKKYGSCCFPSGKYLSLRVLIGEAAGENWWCVLFPSLCLSPALKDTGKTNEGVLVELGFSGDQYKLITESEDNTTYEVRFKILEAIEDLINGK